MKTLKCPHCKSSSMNLIKDSMKQDGIEFEAYRCNRCHEEIMTMRQLKTLASKYRKLRNAKEVKFSKWGNSLAIRIPQELVKEYKLTKGQQGFVTKDKEGIKIIPSP